MSAGHKPIYDTHDYQIVCSDGRRLKLKGHAEALYRAFERFTSAGKSGEMQIEFCTGGVHRIKITEVVVEN